MRLIDVSGALLPTALATLCLVPFSALAQDVPTATATPLTESIVLDGNPNENAWAAAPALTDFIQRLPQTGAPASERTEVRVLYDADALYVGAWLWDSRASDLTFGETRRDASLEDTDALLLVMDTYRDRQNGFVFGTSPAGIEYDGQVTGEGQGDRGSPRGGTSQTGQGSGFNLNWNGSWQVATSRDDRGWYAEFRIPFSTLRYPSGGDQSWGLNVVRRIRRNNEEVFWSAVPRQFDLYRVSRAGTLDGFEAPFRRSAQVSPYVLTSGQWAYSVPEVAGQLQRVSDYDGAFDVGGDAKFALSPALALDLTVNTDFAQVEVDDQQVNLTRFQLFFPEKRPFFLENAGTFAVGTPQAADLFFSRAIGIDNGAEVPIDAGARLTGRVGGMTVGLLNIQTRGVDGVAPANNFGAVRTLKEWDNRTRLGGIFVSRINTDDTADDNYTFGVDGRLGIGQDFTMGGWASGTATPGIDSGEYAYAGDVEYSSLNWNVGGSYREVGDGFNPEVGFLPRSDYRYGSARVLWKWRPEDSSWFRELRPHISWFEFWDLDGFSETRLVHIDSHFEFGNGAFFQLPSTNFTREGLQQPFEISPGVIIPAGTYDNFDWGFAYNTDRSAAIALEGRIDWGGFYSGNRFRTNSTLTGRVGETFVAAMTVDYSDVNLPEGDFEATLLRLRTAYSFTPRIYLQALVQYNDRTDNLSSNLRFGWLNTAGTGLFVVFNDLEYTGNFEDDGLPRGPVDRTFVIKFTKQFNLGG